jgi:methanogenic corrinoid protein MtbC1
MKMKEDKEQVLIERMRNSLANLDVEAAKDACLKGIEVGIDPYTCILEGLSSGL